MAHVASKELEHLLDVVVHGNRGSDMADMLHYPGRSLGLYWETQKVVVIIVPVLSRITGCSDSVPAASPIGLYVFIVPRAPNTP